VCLTWVSAPSAVRRKDYVTHTANLASGAVERPLHGITQRHCSPDANTDPSVSNQGSGFPVRPEEWPDRTYCLVALKDPSFRIEQKSKAGSLHGAEQRNVPADPARTITRGPRFGVDTALSRRVLFYPRGNSSKKLFVPSSGLIVVVVSFRGPRSWFSMHGSRMKSNIRTVCVLVTTVTTTTAARPVLATSKSTTEDTVQVVLHTLS